MALSNEVHDNIASRSYEKFVKAQSQRNPCLQNLARFFNSSRINACRIACLEFSESDMPTLKSLDLVGLQLLLHSPEAGTQSLRGRLLIIEDLSKDVIEMLGSELGIDPFFFAS